MLKYTSFIGLLIVSLVMTACGGASSSAPTETLEATETPSIAYGQEKFTAYCSSCHNNHSKRDARLAPPTIAIQKHYKKAYPEEAPFIVAITDFVLHPTEEKALLTNALEKYALMPAMAYPEDDLNAIASYIYHGTFESPGKGKKKGKRKQAASPLETGQELAASTKAVLGKNLMGSLKEGGPLNALGFCNTKAIHFTDSMANVLSADIKRVSDKPRNPNNKANDAELAAIEAFKNSIQSGQLPEPIVKEEGDGYRFYAPITTNPMCLQCHGNQGEEITPETTVKISELYPTDKATGYGINEVRGIWSIYFEKV